MLRYVPDVLKWLDDLLALLRYGPGVKLVWPAGGGWSGGRVEMLLRRYGIRVYCRQYARKAGEKFGCSVPAAQGRFAEYVCRRAGVPLTNPLIDASNRNVKPGTMPPAWSDKNPKAKARPVGFAGIVVDWLRRG